MSEEKKMYVFAIRKTIAHGWGMAVYQNKPCPLTLRQFVDREIAYWLKRPYVLSRVSREQFIDDARASIEMKSVESKYGKRLGWDYGKAALIAERDGVVFLLTKDSACSSRPYSYAQARDDDEYAFGMLHDLYEMSGGGLAYEEFDPEKHVEGYLMKIDGDL